MQGTSVHHPKHLPLPSPEQPVARRTDGDRQPDVKKHNILYIFKFIFM